MFARARASAVVSVATAAVLVGCAASPAPSAEPGSTPATAREFAVFDGTFITTSGTSPDVDLAWVTVDPFIVVLSDVGEEPTIGFRGPCTNTSYGYDIDEAGVGTIVELQSMTYQACIGARAQHGDWFFEFMAGPSVTFTVDADGLVLTGGAESIVAEVTDLPE